MTLKEQLTDLSLGWEGSPQQRALVGYIKHKILPSNTVHIDSALCLGLGSMERGNVMRKSKSRFAESRGRDLKEEDDWRRKVVGPTAVITEAGEYEPVIPEGESSQQSEKVEEEAETESLADELGFEKLSISDVQDVVVDSEPPPPENEDLPSEEPPYEGEEKLDETLPSLKCADFSGNGAICRLLIFETVVECLREVFGIDRVRFYDRNLTPKDTKLLEGRGHTVIPCSVSDQASSCTPHVVQEVNESTFLFCPTLEVPFAIEAVCMGNPSLFMGLDVLHESFFVVGRLLLLRRRNLTSCQESFHIAPFESFILTHRHRSMKVLGMGDDFGLTWPADLGDEEVLNVQQVRVWNFHEVKENLDECGPENWDWVKNGVQIPKKKGLYASVERSRKKT